MKYTAEIRGRAVVASAALFVVACGAWGTAHVYKLMAIPSGEGHRFATVFAITFLILSWQLLLAYTERPVKLDVGEQAAMDQQKVVVAVPVYNEDPDALRECLRSLLDQERRPQVVAVVDDGSTASDLTAVKAWFVAAASEAGVEAWWRRTVNAGKRHAQVTAFAAHDDADIYITVDSDSILDPRAVGEVIKPLHDEKVTSVAGVVLALNSTRSFIGRITDLWYVVSQLVDRSSLSALGSVLVNSGPLAAYRGPVIRAHMDGYLNETFFGRPVEFSDDSMLTTYSIMHGRTVQQPSAFVFTLMPESAGHHLRQYVRWMRGSFIRSWWRFRYLPLTRPAYWMHALRWLQTILSAVVFVAIFVIAPLRNADVLPWVLVVPFVIGYGLSLRYLTIRRSDLRLRSQLLHVALAPAAVVWSYVVLRFVRYYAIATARRTGWGTRQSVEVGLQPAQPALVAAA